MKSRFEVISQDDYIRVHEASIKILEETGVVFHSEEALQVLKKLGARINGKTAFFTGRQVEDALKTCPQKFELKARNQKHSVEVGEGFLVQPNVGPVFIQDLDYGRRRSKLLDYINIQKLCQASEVVDLVGSTPVDPGDLNQEEKHLHIIYETLRNTDKPVIGCCANTKKVQEQLDMIGIAIGGKNLLNKDHFIAVLVNPLSPLSYSPDTLDTMTEYAKHNQPILLAPCISAGVTGPVSLLGTAVLQNTEILAGIVYIQAVNPGTPVVYSTASSTAYMRTAAFSAGTPEAMLINTVNLQIGLNYYHLPARTMCGITSSKEVDCQAGFETMQSLMLGMQSGAHIAVQCLGVLDSIMTTSYEKIIIDQELIKRVKRIRKGVDVSEESLALEVIKEVGHEASYLIHDSTLDNFRDLWVPDISDWNSYDEWVKEGQESVVKKANKKFKEILQNAPQSLIDSETDHDLIKFIQSKR